MKRILCILTALMLLIVTLTVPAFATSTDEVADQSAFEPLFTDLLNYPEFTINVAGYTIKSKQPLYNYLSQFGPFTLTWGDGSYRYDIGYVLIGIGAAARPVSVTFGGDYTGTLVGADFGVCYTYRFDINIATIDSWKLEIDMGEFNGLVSIDYAYIVNQDSVYLDEVNLRFDGIMSDAEQPYQQNFFDGSVSVPYSYYYATSGRSYISQAYITLDYPFHTSAIDTLSFLFASPNILPNDYNFGGVSIVDLNQGTVTDILDYSLTDSTFNSDYEGHTQYSYCLSVNLSGIDLTNKSLRVRLYMPAKPLGDYGAAFFRFTIRYIAYKLPSHSIPWYLRFFNWIKTEIDQIDTTLNNFFNGNGNTPPDLSDKEDAIQGEIDDMDQIGSDIDDSRQELDELMPDMPSWEDTGLQGFSDVVGAYIQEIRVVFLAIYANNVINQILTYTFLFALGGFILFGER